MGARKGQSQLHETVKGLAREDNEGCSSMMVSFATRMLIAVVTIAAIMAVIAAALLIQRRMTWQVGLWLVIIGLIPVTVNYLWWRRQYAKAALLPYWYTNYTPIEIVVLLVLAVLMIMGLAGAALLVMHRW